MEAILKQAQKAFSDERDSIEPPPIAVYWFFSQKGASASFKRTFLSFLQGFDFKDFWN